MSNKVKGSKTEPLIGYIQSRNPAGKPDSTKECFTLELAEQSLTPLDYSPGDTAAIFPCNPHDEVQAILNATCFLKADDPLQDPRSEQILPFKFFLETKVNLKQVSLQLLNLAKERHSELAPLLDPNATAELKAWLSQMDLPHFLERYPLNCDPLLFIKALSPLLPRFYSISTAPELSPNAVGLLIACFSRKVGPHERVGVASDYLCHQAKITSSPIHFYIRPNPQFKPPHPEAPLIMIGPGTGVAPFRAFMQQRFAQNAKSNWLFFGARESALDFYYESEWNSYIQNGFLKLSTAFSRDGSQKLYVQHRLFEAKEELWRWIGEKAHIYICGDALHMARDVMETLMEIAQTEGAMSVEESRLWLKEMRSSGHVKLDVY